MAKKGNDTTLAPSAGEGWDAWGAACGFTSWAKAAEAIGITVSRLVTIRKKAPRKTIRLAMDAVLAVHRRAVPGEPKVCNRNCDCVGPCKLGDAS